MNDLKIMPKPDYVSWEDISELLQEANKVNERKGFSMSDLKLPPDGLKQQVEGEGLCVVALVDDKLVGVSACNLGVMVRWFNKRKKCARKFMTGILKSYQGCGILYEMDKVLDDYIRSCGCDMIVASTAEDNKSVRKNSKLGGCKEVAYESFRSANYYSVIFAKWFDGCPYPDWYIRLRFSLSRLYVKTRFKEGRIERFAVLRLAKRIKKKLKK